MKEPKKVEVVTMDMWSGYRSAAYETLPNATAVIDKFHVVKMATEQMDSTRKHYYKNAPYGLKKSKGIFLVCEDKISDKGKGYRDAWFDQFPKLKTAYELKESFFRIYNCFITVTADEHEIFNYFETPYTNAFVEGLNSVIRSISDKGRGYDFDILRGKVLL